MEWLTSIRTAIDYMEEHLTDETVCCLYHQKKDFISVPYEPKAADNLETINEIMMYLRD